MVTVLTEFHTFFSLSGKSPVMGLQKDTVLLVLCLPSISFHQEISVGIFIVYQIPLIYFRSFRGKFYRACT